MSQRARRVGALLAAILACALLVLGTWAILEARSHPDPIHGGGYLLVSGAVFIILGLLIAMVAFFSWPRAPRNSGPAA